MTANHVFENMFMMSAAAVTTTAFLAPNVNRRTENMLGWFASLCFLVMAVGAVGLMVVDW